jgi:hypothetical protein
MAQIELFGPDISGQFTAVVVEDPTNTPTNVIPSDSAWRIDCEWFLTPPGKIVGGSWRLQAIVEGLGTATEFETAAVTVPIDGRVQPPGPNYTQSINFPPPQAVLGASQDSVLLKVGVALTYRTLQNTPGPFAAFLDLGVIQVYRNT